MAETPFVYASRRNHHGRDIYFVQPVDGGLIKIGSATNPQERFKAIQACSPIRLRILALIQGAGEVRERSLHHRFEHLREHGEWFRPAPDLLAYIAEHATDPYDPPQSNEVAAS